MFPLVDLDPVTILAPLPGDTISDVKANYVWNSAERWRQSFVKRKA